MGQTFSVPAGYENHPMTMVSWFGAWGYCQYYGWRLPTEMEWEKAARGTDARPFPWGDEIVREKRQLLRQPRSVRRHGHLRLAHHSGRILQRQIRTTTTRRSILLRLTACMIWLATSGNGPATCTKGCTIASCAAARRIPTKWICASGCATMPHRPISAPVWVSGVCGKIDETWHSRGTNRQMIDFRSNA